MTHISTPFTEFTWRDWILGIITAATFANVTSRAKFHRWIWDTPHLTILSFLLILCIAFFFICFGGILVLGIVNLWSGSVFENRSDREIARSIRTVFMTVLATSLFIALF
jgi:hypothetical protein